MRYEPDHKARIHRRIVKNASRQLRAKGLNGAAVTTVMKASGLTHGGFYRHFGSRDDLVVEAIEESLQELRDRLIAAAKDAEPGEGWKAKPFEIHQVLSLDTYFALEVSTPEVDDIIRLKDLYNRPGGRIESEHKQN